MNGVAAGDAVHLCLRNSPAFIAVWLATAKLGAWMVPVDPASSSRDIETQLGRVSPKIGFYATQRAEIYRAGLDYADRMYLTLVERAFAGDARFPELDDEEWVEIEALPHEPDEKNPHPFTFVTLERRAEAGFG